MLGVVFVLGGEGLCVELCVVGLCLVGDLSVGDGVVLCVCVVFVGYDEYFFFVKLREVCVYLCDFECLFVVIDCDLWYLLSDGSWIFGIGSLVVVVEIVLGC